MQHTGAFGVLPAGMAESPASWTSWPKAVRKTANTGGEALACRRAVLRESRRRTPRPLGRASWLRDVSARVGRRMGLSVAVRGPVPSEACIIASNHMSYLDPLAIGQIVPCSAVAKSEITGWPAIGQTMEQLGVVFVERGNPRSGAATLRKVMRTLAAGVPVLIFPEGTTTWGTDVLPFSRGAFGAARILRVPVVPTLLRYELEDACWVGDASLLPHLLNIHRHEELRAEVIFGPALQPMAFSDASTLAEATRQCIRSLLVQ